MCSDSVNSQRPALVQVVGTSGSGKTTLIERLIPRLRAKGIRIGTVKHAHHGFETDQPGKDSWRHAQAGSEAVAVISPERAAWVIRTPEELSVDRAINMMGGRVDLVLGEGFKGHGAPRAIRLEPNLGERLEIGTATCRVGVHPGTLRPGELEQIAAFCVSVLREREPCQQA